mmetsp:Transcript_10003/g.14099  ORF Transcript_10003/g.14099 Transcript_10003/m.14099 type:complete len:199 (+) Transcript_10003:3-599(+)
MRLAFPSVAMMRLFGGLLALLLLHVHADQPTFDYARVAATLESKLRSASRSLRHQLSTQKPQLLRRRLTATNESIGPCAMVNGACTLADSFASDLASNLPAASDARRFFEEWQACAVNSMTDCNATQGCSWDTDGNECAPSSDVEIQAMDWFDFTGCGILESADQSARCEAQTVCSAMAGCSEVQDDQFDVGARRLGC